MASASSYALKAPLAQQKIVVDSSDRPRPDGIGWKPGAHSPFGSYVFSLVEAEEYVCQAVVYAAMGMPTDQLDANNFEQTGSARAWELFDIETEPAHRRKGHATGADGHDLSHRDRMQPQPFL